VAGMSVDVGTTAAPTNSTSTNAITATGGSAGAYTITVTTAFTATAAEFVFRTGSGGDATNSTQKELTGVQTIVAASGTLWNVNPTTYPVWVSTVKSNSGTNRAISENLMAQTVHAINRASGTWPNMAVGSDGVQRAFAATLTSAKRFVNTVDVSGGYGKGISFIAGGGTEMPLTFDRDCPSNSVFFFNTKHLFEYQMSDWEFMEDDGAVLSRVSNQDAYEFTLRKYHEFTTDRRNAHGLLSDITEA